MIFKNKHVIIAMLVAPVLAVIAYFGVDYIVSEKPHAAVEGNAYPLVAKSNCRYSSGRCTFKNGDINIEITPDFQQEKPLLKISSSHPVEGIKLGISDVNGQSSGFPQLDMQTTNGLEWHTVMPSALSDNMAIQLVAKIEDVLYYGETGMAFALSD